MCVCVLQYATVYANVGVCVALKDVHCSCFVYSRVVQIVPRRCLCSAEFKSFLVLKIRVV